jgi:hypothetical protein
MQRKVIVSEEEFVECPYCQQGPNNQFKRIHWKHLKCEHNKSLDIMWNEFPEVPTITRKE